MQKYDVVIIGAGSSGVNTATMLANKGMKILVVGDKVGGNYHYSGSIASNSLYDLCKMYSNFTHTTVKFLDTNGDNLNYKLNIKKVRKFIESKINKTVKVLEKQLADNKIGFIQGKAVFQNKNSIAVESENLKTVVGFTKAVIATGAVRKKLDISVKVNLLSYDNIMSFGRIPSSIAIVGGGFAGCEFAVNYNNLGSAVTIIEKENRILNGIEPQLVKKVEEQFKKRGITILKDTKITNIDKIGNKGIIFFEKGDKCETEEIFLSTGSVPNIENLELEKACVVTNGDLIVLNERLQTTNENVYVVGDATNKDISLAYTNVSSELVANEILKMPYPDISRYIPTVVRLDPNIASVGYTEEKAKKSGHEIQTVKYSYPGLEKIRESTTKGFIKVIFDKKSKKILGVHVIGYGAAEIVSIFAVLMQSGSRVDVISGYLFHNSGVAEIITGLASKVKI